MSKYQTFVEHLAVEKNPMIFPNSSAEHAAIVLSTMLNHSNDEVIFYEDCLDGDLTELHDGMLYKSIEKFLSKPNSKLRIAVKDQKISSSKIYALLKKHSLTNKAKIKVVSEAFVNNIVSAFSKDLLFAVADTNAIRIETYDPLTSEKTDNPREAYCSFLQPTMGEKLKAAFFGKFNDCPDFIFA